MFDASKIMSMRMCSTATRHPTIVLEYISTINATDATPDQVGTQVSQSGPSSGTRWRLMEGTRSGRQQGWCASAHPCCGQQPARQSMSWAQSTSYDSPTRDQ